MTGISGLHVQAKQGSAFVTWALQIIYLLPNNVRPAVLKRIPPHWISPLWFSSGRGQPIPTPRGVPVRQAAMEVQCLPEIQNLMQIRSFDSKSDPLPSKTPEKGSEWQYGQACWWLLLPVCSRAGSPQIWSDLTMFARSLLATTSAKERESIVVLVGIDQGDDILDTKDGKDRVQDCFADICRINMYNFPDQYGGRICDMWSDLARHAVENGAEFFVLLGDDIELLTQGWKKEIEAKFARIAVDCGLPHGVGCVAFRDEEFDVFPTFPVLNRKHFEIFQELMPPDFVNQHGDPFLFEIYRRYGASCFAEKASLRNKVGGKGEARYAKHSELIWRDKILSKALSTLAEWMRANGLHDKEVPCLDVIVPTYRCDRKALERITNLKPSTTASVHTIVVVDRPDAENLSEIVQLKRWERNSTVRVVTMPKNLGASTARNMGLSQSFGDHAVLLDDDVLPNKQILDAYLGAIARFPHARVYMGLTELEPPRTWMQRALVASHMTFFYNIALRFDNPPWGVTANMCVKSRTNNKVWFSDVFPRTGGGEDVDFCLRLKEQKASTCVAVPGARVVHPYWQNILRQVRGWARGDVLCLGTVPHLCFYAFPNWAESILFICLWAVAAVQFAGMPVLDVSWRAVEMSCVVLPVHLVMMASQYFPSTRREGPLVSRIAVCMLATLPVLHQDIERVVSKLRRLRFNQLCLNFDWLDGQQDHVVGMRLSLFMRSVVTLLTLSLLHCNSVVGLIPLCSALALCTVLWMHYFVGGEDVSDPKATLQDPIKELAAHSRADLRELVDLLTAFTHNCCSLQAKAHLKIDTPPSASTDKATTPRLSHTRTSLTQTQPDVNIYPQFWNPKCNPFVILTFQCTGSDLLCDLLHRHPQIAMHTDLLHRTKIPKDEWVSEWSIEKRNRNPGFFLSDALARGGTCLEHGGTARAAGFKLFPEEWNASPEVYEACNHVVSDPRVFKIVLVRENRLHTYVSMRLASATTGQSPKQNHVKVSPHELQNFAEDYDKLYRFYMHHLCGQHFHTISYEQLTGTQSDLHVQALLRFLGVDTEASRRPQIQNGWTASIQNMKHPGSVKPTDALLKLSGA